uniref:Hyaluronidase n=1 Tax=Sphenodon punctatus TaxID=8508 RepID=A0A8D0L1Z5_SPHPU
MKADLVHTLGESAALGAAGVVLWGNNSYSHSADSCRNLRKYITTTLGPYVVNVTMAAHMCSHQLCHGNGRCVRRQPGELRAFLHLAPQQWEGEPMLTNFLDMDGPAWELFQCHCYPRWMGARCNKQQWVEPIQNPDCPMVTQHQDTCLAAHDCSSAMGLGLCPHPDYEEKTELR